MTRGLLATCAVATLLAGCGGSAKKATKAAAPALPTLSFAYTSEPLAYTDHGAILRRPKVTVRDVGFQSGPNRVDGYLVEDARKGKHPAVVLVHGAGADRQQLVGDAVALAERGFVALTITEPSTSHPPVTATSAQQLIAQSKQVTIDDVIAVRRAADVLSTLPNVDAARLGYLGWSNGAKVGAFVAAKDDRFKALVLLSGGADTLAAFAKSAPKSVRPLVRRQLGLVDPLRYIATAPAGRLLLEDGRKDEVVPRAALLNMIHAAPKGTLIHWYPAGHELSGAAYQAAFAWLAQKLAA